MFSAGQYRSTEKGYDETIYSNLNSTEWFYTTKV